MRRNANALELTRVLLKILAVGLAHGHAAAQSATTHAGEEILISGDILGERARLSPDAIALIHAPQGASSLLRNSINGPVVVRASGRNFVRCGPGIACASFPRTALNMLTRFGPRASLA